jgi:hypothetical protein
MGYSSSIPSTCIHHLLLYFHIESSAYYYYYYYYYIILSIISLKYLHTSDLLLMIKEISFLKLHHSVNNQFRYCPDF